jgi:hypothetical protein
MFCMAVWLIEAEFFPDPQAHSNKTTAMKGNFRILQ